MINKIEKVLIIGVGLIGGSIALSIKKSHPSIHIIGYDSDASTVEMAEKLNVIDEGVTSFVEASKRADVIFLCTPVRISVLLIDELAKLELKPDVIVTDVGSTKSEIVERAIVLQNNDITFIGGHPMAGSHKSGVTAATSDLFENAYYLLTPEHKSDEKTALVLEKLLVGTRAKFIRVTPHEHDEITGMLSHLPHVIAAGLVNQADDFMQDHPMAFNLAAGGFRDITRIASSDPVMWTDILLSNQEILLEQISNWQHEMNQISNWIANEDALSIRSFFDQAKITRDKLPIHKKGAMPAFYDLFVDIPDYPGVIAEVTGLLAQANISLINVKILETREDVYGILQITFKTYEAMQRGKECIESQTDFMCYEK